MTPKRPISATAAANFVNIALLMLSLASPTDRFTVSVAAALALSMCSVVSVSRGNLQACLHLARALSTVFDPSLLTLPVAATSALTHIFIAWQLLDVGIKTLALRCLYEMFEVRGFALVVLGKRRTFTVEDIRDPAFSVIDILTLEWMTMTCMLVIDTLVKLATHARRLVFIALLTAVSRSGHELTMLELGTLFVVWQLLTFTIPARGYFNTIKTCFNKRKQALIYSRLLAVYAVSRSRSYSLRQIEYKVEVLVCDVEFIVFIISTALVEALNVWVAARKIGWRVLVPVIIAFAHWLLSRAVNRRIERLRKQSRVSKPPNFQKSFGCLLSNIRTIKFYAWEDVFCNALWSSLDIKEYVPPMIWRVLRFGLDILGSATAEVSAALAITSYINVAGTISYTDIALLMESIRSLTTFTATVTRFSKVLENINKNLGILQRYIEPDTTKYIERIPIAGDSAVEFDECVFSWSTNSYSLASITLQIKAGDFVTVVGRIGSGKSSFLSAICGEMPLKSGRGCVHGRIGYVEQKSWIMNATFRDNVLMGADFDKAYFWQVVDACALAADVQLFPSGDLTMIGTNGVNLSGGQKVRLALARALYLRADIYVLDDLLSAVDPHVERHIVERVLAADGIIGQKTRILVTHAEHLVPLSDTVITFVDGGMSIARQIPLALSTISIDNLDSKESMSGSDSGSADQQAGEVDIYNRLPGYRAVVSAWSVIRRLTLLSGYGTVVFVMITQCVKAYALYYSESLRTGLMTDSNPTSMVQSLKHYLIANALVEIGRHQLNNLEAWAREAVWSATLAAKMREQVLDLILSMPLPLLESLPYSSMSDLFHQSRWSVSNALPRALSQDMLHDMLSAVSAIAQVVKSSPGLMLLCGPFVALNYAIERWYGDTTSKLGDVRRDSLDQHIEQLETVFHLNRPLLRVHGVTRIHVDKLCQFCFMKLQYASCISAVRGSLYLTTTLCTEAITTAVLAFKLYQQLYASIPMSPGELDAVINLALGLFYRTRNVITQDSLSEFHTDHFSRYIAYMEGAPREQPRIIEGSRPLASWPETGKIEFRQYSLRYRPELKPMLNGLDFVIRSKERVGIVGRTGAGKSSLTNALMRLVEADSGSIVIDGTDISTIGLYDLRSRIGIIPQDPSLFEGTIRDNLDPTRQYTDDEVWAAINTCQIAGLLDTPTGKYTEKPVTADDDDEGSKGRWVEGTGLDKWIEYNGSNFSVGQRQLVSLCRALLWRRKILVLDEATANVDTETDQIMQSVIRHEFKDCTVLTIAHRLNTIMDSDRILVMDEGKVAEFDTPANLLARDSHFSKLVESMNLSQRQV
ncbi:Canalicular multispecific organic anion transporter 1 [Coemansia sp. S146]|nr:Canalicular multispecific organic anion transporter 1 [Coemansia sp. S146]